MKKEVIFIEKGERAPLPSKYRPLNNLCAVIYDHLTEIYQSDIYKPLVGTSIQFETEQQGIDLQASPLHVLDYLKSIGYTDHLTTVLTKHVLLAVVSDLINFVFESISCAKRGKMTVAYALLRKPFKEELLLLESLLVSPDDFINKLFHDGNPASYDPSGLGEEQKRLIIEMAVKKARPFFFDANQLFDFRYNRSFSSGISGFSDQALHIVTKNKKYPTSEKNLNFVFSTQEDVDSYWSHYYRLVAYLLLYTAAVVDGIVFQFLNTKPAKDRYNMKVLQRFVGMMLWLGKAFPNINREKILFAHKESISLTCEKCDARNELDMADYELYFYMQILICKSCLHKVVLNPRVINILTAKL